MIRISELFIGSVRGFSFVHRRQRLTECAECGESGRVAPLGAERAGTLVLDEIEAMAGGGRKVQGHAAADVQFGEGCPGARRHPDKPGEGRRCGNLVAGQRKTETRGRGQSGARHRSARISTIGLRVVGHPSRADFARERRGEFFPLGFARQFVKVLWRRGRETTAQRERRFLFFYFRAKMEIPTVAPAKSCAGLSAPP